MGSRILSRSFQVSRWQGESRDEEDDQDDTPNEANTSIDSAAMDVDNSPSNSEHGKDDHDEDDESDENEDDPADVAMVPMADLLNAQYESENVSPTYIGLVKEWLKPWHCQGETLLRGTRPKDDHHKGDQGRRTDCK